MLKRTMFQEQIIFSGQESEGFVVFPSLAPDVKEFSIHVRGIALRYNYRDEPVETKDLIFHFQREVFKGFKPPPELVNKQ